MMFFVKGTSIALRRGFPSLAFKRQKAFIKYLAVNKAEPHLHPVEVREAREDVLR